MNNPLWLAEFLSTPWALMPERLLRLTTMLLYSDVSNSEAQIGTSRRQNTTSTSGNGIAVLPLHGIITQRGNLMHALFGDGSVSTQDFSAALRQLLVDDSVNQILIDIDSPGGSVYGVSELADEIIAARSIKPVVAVANSLAASAAYWLGCCASSLYVTPGGEVGSIGVWQAHFDYSQALNNEGIIPTLISAGQYKVEGNPYQPLQADAQTFMQSRVDEYYSAFTKGVAKGRGAPIAQVREGMGQGRVLGATSALENNMVDGIATFDAVLRKMRREINMGSKTKPQSHPQHHHLYRAQRALSIVIV